MNLREALDLSKIATMTEGNITFYATNMVIYAEKKMAKFLVEAYKVDDLSKIINRQDWRPIGRLGDGTE